MDSIINIQHTLVAIDNAADYIPGVSTITNLVDLFQKSVILSLQSNETIENNHYFTHLNDKSFRRSVILLIPVLGNIIVYLSDKKMMITLRLFYLCGAFMGCTGYWVVDDMKSCFNIMDNWSEPKARPIIDAVNKYRSNWVYKLDWPNMLLGIEEITWLKSTSGWQKDEISPYIDDDELMYAAVLASGSFLRLASERIQMDRKFVYAAVGHYTGGDQGRTNFFRYAKPQFQADEEIAFKAVTSDGRELEYASDELKNNKRIVLAAIEQDEEAYEFASPELKNDEDVKRAAGILN